MPLSPALTFELPVDGWYHVAPPGEFRHTPSETAQVLDQRAFEMMAARFAREAQAPRFAGLLVDFDHFSQDPHQLSAAAGWVTALAPRPDGLWARIRWSDAGEAAVRGGRYRFLSPVWYERDCEAIASDARPPTRRLRPLRLARLGLTNDPNLHGLTPLTNRRDQSPIPRANEPQQERKTMNQLMIELGLAPDAAEEAVITAVQGLKNRAASAERHAAEVEQTNRALAQAQVEADLDHFAARFKPEAKPKWKEALIANRETALALLESLPEAPAATAPMHNRAGAATPAAGPADFPAAFQSEITAGKSRSEAVDAARAKYPELHQTWLKNGGAAHL